jgi:hypothetical protein
LYGVALDSNASLSLEIHIVEQLVLFFALGYRSSRIKQTVSQGALTVIDMGNDAKVSDILHSKGASGTKQQANKDNPLFLP